MEYRAIVKMYELQLHASKWMNVVNLNVIEKFLYNLETSTNGIIIQECKYVVNNQEKPKNDKHKQYSVV